MSPRRRGIEATRGPPRAPVRVADGRDGRQKTRVAGARGRRGGAARVAEDHERRGNARACRWCGAPLDDELRAGSRYHSKACRQAAFRLRRRRDRSATPADDGGRTFAYADPPYLGFCALYDHHHPDGRCWNDPKTHRLLIRRLSRQYPAGWALSCSSDSLGLLLSFCPPTARACPWVKPSGADPRTNGPHALTEYVILVGGRKVPPGVRDFLIAKAARGRGGDLPGRKPIAFCAWLFDLLGMMPGDQLADLFPGTGIVGRAWADLSSRAALGDAKPGRRVVLASPDVLHDAEASLGPGDDAGPQLASLRPARDAASPRTRRDALGSLGDRDDASAAASLGHPGDAASLVHERDAGRAAASPLQRSDAKRGRRR